MQLIATKVRDFVYNDDSSDTATTLSSEFSGPRQSATYDPLKLRESLYLDLSLVYIADSTEKRLEANPACKS